MKNLRALFTTIFLFQGGFTFYTTFAGVFLITRFNFSQGNIGDFFSFVGIWVAITQAITTRKLSKYFSEMQIIRFSIPLAGIFVFLYLFTQEWWQLLFIVPFFAAGIGLTLANMTALVSRSVDKTVQGEILGVNFSVTALAQSIPPVLSGFIAANLTPETPILVASVVMLIAAGVFLLFYKKSMLQQQL